MGGAQAIAALAYGTETIRPVDKIVGPGQRLGHRGQAPGASTDAPSTCPRGRPR